MPPTPEDTMIASETLNSMSDIEVGRRMLRLLDMVTRRVASVHGVLTRGEADAYTACKDEYIARFGEAAYRRLGATAGSR